MFIINIIISRRSKVSISSTETFLFIQSNLKSKKKSKKQKVVWGRTERMFVRIVREFKSNVAVVSCNYPMLTTSEDKSIIPQMLVLISMFSVVVFNNFTIVICWSKSDQIEIMYHIQIRLYVKCTSNVCNHI